MYYRCLPIRVPADGYGNEWSWFNIFIELMYLLSGVLQTQIRIWSVFQVTIYFRFQDALIDQITYPPLRYKIEEQINKFYKYS